jgi:hypothetical protein
LGLKSKALIVGGGGTLAYFGVLVAIELIAEHLGFESKDTLVVGLIPLVPSMIPGLLVDWVISFSPGSRYDNVHGFGFIAPPLLSAPIVNAYLAYIWMRRRAIAKSV